jgi:hypothetical protein
VSEGDAERWDARYRGRAPFAHPLRSWIDDLGLELPVRGPALDVGAGTAPMACWAAARGLDALALDASEVGLAVARQCAAASGVEIRTRRWDADSDSLPNESFALVTCFHFLLADFFSITIPLVRPGALVITEHHTVANLQRHAHPSRRFLVTEGAMEAAARVAGWTILYASERWVDDRHLARVVARSPMATGGSLER